MFQRERGKRTEQQNTQHREHSGRRQIKPQIHQQQKMILRGICMAYKDFGKSKIHFIGVDNMSIELPKNEKKKSEGIKGTTF